jgi:hypothetical protein
VDGDSRLECYGTATSAPDARLDPENGARRRGVQVTATGSVATVGGRESAEDVWEDFNEIHRSQSRTSATARGGSTRKRSSVMMITCSLQEREHRQVSLFLRTRADGVRHKGVRSANEWQNAAGRAPNVLERERAETVANVRQRAAPTDSRSSSPRCAARRGGLDASHFRRRGERKGPGFSGMSYRAWRLRRAGDCGGRPRLGR